MSEYTNAILSSNRPEQAAALMKERLAKGLYLNEEISDWVRERARIEERYASDLEKLAARPIPPTNGTMGKILAPVWTSIVKTVHDSANASLQLSSKLHSNVQVPLRRFAKSNAVQDLNGLQHGLQQLALSLAKSEDTHHRMTTGKKKGTASEIEQAQIKVAEVQSQWENQAPFAMEQFEQVDHERIVLLKDLLSGMETLEIDRFGASTKTCEQALNNILAVEPQDEIQMFASHVMSGDVHAVGITGPRRQQSMGAVADHDDDLYDEQHHNQQQHHQRPNPPFSQKSTDSSSVHSKEKNSRVKLRSKVGSIFGKKNKKEKHQQPQIEAIQESSEPWPAAAVGATGASVASTSSRRPSQTSGYQQQHHQHVSPGHQASGGGGGNTNAPLPPPPPPPHRQSSINNPTPPPPPPPPSRKTNGVRDDKEVDAEGYTIPKNTGIGFDSYNNNNGSGELPGHEESEQPFKVDIRQDTITEEGKNDDDNVALSTVASKLRARPTVSGRAQRGRRDIQSRLFTNIEASDLESNISNGDGQSPTSPTANRPPSQLLNQLQTFPGAGIPNVPVQEEEVVEQEKDQETESEVQSPIQPQSTSSTMESSSVASPTGAAAPVMHSDNQSVRSARSSTSTLANASNKHGELPIGTALAATCVETVNVIMTDGVVSQVAGGGEIALGYSGHEESIDIKIDGMSSNLIPNQNILQQKAGESSTVFKIGGTHALKNLTSGLVALKYVLQPEDYRVPLLFTPIWRLEENQASLMLTYKLDSSFTEPVVVEELVISVPVEDGPAESAQSKPMAVFSKSKQRCTWRFSDPFTLQPGAEQQLLCRFMTLAKAREGSRGIDIKLRVSQLTPPAKLFYAPSRDPFGDNTDQESEPEWAEANMTRTICSGRYQASSDKNVKIM